MRVQRCVERAADGTSDWVVYFVSIRLWRSLGVEKLRSETLLALIDRTPGLRLTSGRQTDPSHRRGRRNGRPTADCGRNADSAANREYQTEDGRTVLFGWIDHTTSSHSGAPSPAR